ncbi:MAG: hypothetical protein ACOC33_00855 [bacterium]
MTEYDDEYAEAQTEVNEIKEEFSSDRVLLEEQIEHIKLIEQKLSALIYDLESANIHFQSLLQNEKDNAKKKSYHSAIAFNVERLTKLYSVLREYQDTKYKYLSCITDLTVKKHKIISIDLSKLKNTTSEDTYNLFNNLISAMNSNNKLPVSDEIEEINNSEDYKI